MSILNTGHLGYSPEQYYYSLLAFADRFSPHFVVVSVFANDFGEGNEVWHGKGDWDEGKYWLDRIAQLCISAKLAVPVRIRPVQPADARAEERRAVSPAVFPTSSKRAP